MPVMQNLLCFLFLARVIAATPLSDFSPGAL